MTEWHGIPEKWDPSWSYNFAWGVSSEGKVHVWRVKGHHDLRKELEKEWERPSHVGSGDTLGQAQYIPAEMKVDGTIVAPPEIQVQVFYGCQLPQALIDWFEHQFPGTVVREAHHRTARQHIKPVAREWQPQIPSRLKWEEKDGKIVIDAVHSVLPVELAEFKAELAKRFPDKEIVAPEYGNDPRKDEYDPKFVENQQRLKREASAKWAWKHLALDERAKFTRFPVLIDKNGKWFIGDASKSHGTILYEEGLWNNQTSLEEALKPFYQCEVNCISEPDGNIDFEFTGKDRWPLLEPEILEAAKQRAQVWMQHDSSVAVNGPEIDSKPLQDDRRVRIPSFISKRLERLTGR